MANYARHVRINRRGGGYSMEGRNRKGVGMNTPTPISVPTSHIMKHSIIAAFVSVIFVAPVLWMLMDRTPPYTFEHVEVSPDNVVQGGEIEITFIIKQNRPPCDPGLIYREYKGATGQIHVFDPIQRSRSPTVVDNKFTRVGRIPAQIAPGPAVYRGSACYTCNPLQSWLRWPVCVRTPDVEFNVIPKDTKP
jgi:hypothetical protein